MVRSAESIGAARARHLVLTTLAACDVFAEVLGDTVQFPPDLAPDHHLFIRSVCGPSLMRTQETVRNGSPWWDERPRVASAILAARNRTSRSPSSRERRYR